MSRPGRRQNGEFKSQLTEWGFSSLTPVHRFAPHDNNDNPVGAPYYRAQCRIMGTVPTPLGETWLTAEHAKPAPHVWLFDGGIRGEGNSNEQVRVLLADLQGALFGFIQQLSPTEGIDPETGKITFADE